MSLLSCGPKLTADQLHAEVNLQRVSLGGRSLAQSL